MTSITLDDVDQGILYALQRNARNNSASTIADEIDVAPNTVRNRIQRLETAGVIQGYYPHIDFEAAGYQLHVIFVCTVPISRRKELAEAALQISGVIEVVEVLSGRENLTVEAIGTDGDDITEIAKQLEELGLEVYEERLVKSRRIHPLDHFENNNRIVD